MTRFERRKQLAKKQGLGIAIGPVVMGVTLDCTEIDGSIGLGITTEFGEYTIGVDARGRVKVRLESKLVHQLTKATPEALVDYGKPTRRNKPSQDSTP